MLLQKAYPCKHMEEHKLMMKILMTILSKMQMHICESEYVMAILKVDVHRLYHRI